jgi:hypothetical protein
MEPPAWGPARRLGFRFAFLYWLLYGFPFPLSNLPYTGWILEPWSRVEDAFVLWCGEHVLGIQEPIATESNGSGDTTYAFVQLAIYPLLALLGALLWTALTRRKDERGLWPWTSGYVRLLLGTAMVSYGSYKVLPSQFPPPALDRLAQPFGEASPMGLLWTFMGTSSAYQIFTGAGGQLGGVLLFQRRRRAGCPGLHRGAGASRGAQLLLRRTGQAVLGASPLMGVFLLPGSPTSPASSCAAARRRSPFRASSPHRACTTARARCAPLGLCLPGAERDVETARPTPCSGDFDGLWRVGAFVDESPARSLWAAMEQSSWPTRCAWASGAPTSACGSGSTGANGPEARARGTPFQAEFTYEQPSPDELRWPALDGHAVQVTCARQPTRYTAQPAASTGSTRVPFSR